MLEPAGTGDASPEANASQSQAAAHRPRIPPPGWRGCRPRPSPSLSPPGLETRPSPRAPRDSTEGRGAPGTPLRAASPRLRLLCAATLAAWKRVWDPPAPLLPPPQASRGGMAPLPGPRVCRLLARRPAFPSRGAEGRFKDPNGREAAFLPARRGVWRSRSRQTRLRPPEGTASGGRGLGCRGAPRRARPARAAAGLGFDEESPGAWEGPWGRAGEARLDWRGLRGRPKARGAGRPNRDGGHAVAPGRRWPKAGRRVPPLAPRPLPVV